MTKLCPKCNQIKNVTDFSKSRKAKDGLQCYCKLCHRASVLKCYYKNPGKIKQHAKEWAKANPDRRKNILKKYRVGLRKKVLDHYGWVCKFCGESEPKFLCIDHKNGGGKKHRRIINGGGHNTYRWLIKNGFPEEFQTLCWNCNALKTTNGSKSNCYKDAVFEHYGKICECCNTSRPLTIDHIDGQGHQLSGDQLYRWIVKMDFPERLRTLCWNCNCGRAINNGICPHKTS